MNSLLNILSLGFLKDGLSISLIPSKIIRYTRKREVQLPPIDADAVLVDEAAPQTLRNKQLTLPKVNENAPLTATSTELNQLDGVNLQTLLASIRVPSGSVSAYAGSSAPTGYLICDGSEVSQTTYADLYAAIGSTYNTSRNQATGSNWAAPGAGNFRLPDYRGSFLRGVGTSTGYGTTTLGGFQDDATAVNNLTHPHTHIIDHDHPAFNTSSSGAHYHTVQWNAWDASASIYSNQWGTNYWIKLSSGDPGSPRMWAKMGHGYTGNGGAEGAHAHSIDVPNFTGTSGAASTNITSIDAETRPANVGVNYIIKI